MMFMRRVRAEIGQRAIGAWCAAKAKLACEKGQGTTEYAILVGVLAVIAMLAVTAFKGKVTELWDAITNGMNGL